MSAKNKTRIILSALNEVEPELIISATQKINREQLKSNRDLYKNKIADRKKRTRELIECGAIVEKFFKTRKQKLIEHYLKILSADNYWNRWLDDERVNYEREQVTD